MDFSEVESKVLDFRKARDWQRFHNPKDLAISISIEAAELLEIFQWSGTDLKVENKLADAKDELADILIYCIYMAHALEINIPDIINEKLDINNMKYPVQKAYGNAKKYSEL